MCVLPLGGPRPHCSLKTATAPVRRRPSVVHKPGYHSVELAILSFSSGNNHRYCGPEVLFQASMEFLGNEDGDTDEDEAVSFAGGPQRPAVSPVALETLPMRYDHARREAQMAAVAMGVQLHASSKFTFTCEDYFILRLKSEFELNLRTFLRIVVFLLGLNSSI